MDSAPATMDTSGFGSIRFERHGAVLECVIDNPRSELNAVDAELHRELALLFRRMRDEAQARAILLTGSKKAFSAGGDFHWFRTLRSPKALETVRREGKDIVWDLLDVPLPVVCAVNGHAMGLGASIALLCDVIFMADTARLGDPHVRAGIVAGDGGTAIWPLAMGPALAKRFLMTGDHLSAADAERLGLVTHVAPAAEVRAAALAFAQRLAAGAPLAVQYTKMAVNKLVKDALNTAFDVATGHELVTFMSRDHDEAVNAFLEKREPHFDGS